MEAIRQRAGNPDRTSTMTTSSYGNKFESEKENTGGLDTGIEYKARGTTKKNSSTAAILATLAATHIIVGRHLVWPSE